VDTIGTHTNTYRKRDGALKSLKNIEGIKNISIRSNQKKNNNSSSSNNNNNNQTLWRGCNQVRNGPIGTRMTGEDKLLRCFVACGAAVGLERNRRRVRPIQPAHTIPHPTPPHPVASSPKDPLPFRPTLDSLILHNREEVVEV
jgi:hypothetical protein